MFRKRNDTEEELISLIARGDEAAFGRLFNHYRDRIYSIAYKLTHSTDAAQEIVQDVFLKIWQKRADLPAILHFQAYLFVVTRNHAYKVLRHIARMRTTVSFSPEEEVIADDDAQRALLDKEYGILLRRAVDGLSTQQKEVYTLMKEQGLKREEVARLLSLRPETVKSHLAQAMKNIRHFCTVHLEMLVGLILCLHGFLFE